MIKDRWRLLLVNAPVVYIMLYMFMPYKPWGLPVAPSTLFLILSFPFVVNQMITSWKTTVSAVEKTFVCLIILTLFISIGFNLNVMSISGIISCLSSVIGFLYLRLTYVPNIHQSKLFKYFQIYVLLSGISIILEIFLGRQLFISNYIIDKALRNPGYRFGSGFASYASLTGGLILWPLSMLTARYVLQKNWKIDGLQNQSKSLVVIFLGLIGLYYTLARSSWVGFAIALLFTFFALIAVRGKFKYFTHIIAGFTIIFAAISFWIPKDIYYTNAIGAQIIIKTESIPHLVNFAAENIIGKTFFTPSEKIDTVDLKEFQDLDPSATTRVLIYEYAWKLLSKYPLWGIGIDRFPVLYESYANELQKMEEYKNVKMDALTRLDLHNFILTYMIEIGLIPGLFFFVFIFYYFGRAFATGVNVDTFPPLVGLVSVCIWMCFTGFLKERPLWFALGILGSSLAFTVNHNQKINGLKK